MNDKCTHCSKCVLTCPQNALTTKEGKIVLNKNKCIGCLCCDEVCPNNAVNVIKKIRTGERY